MSKLPAKECWRDFLSMADNDFIEFGKDFRDKFCSLKGKRSIRLWSSFSLSRPNFLRKAPLVLASSSVKKRYLLKMEKYRIILINKKNKKEKAKRKKHAHKYTY